MTRQMTHTNDSINYLSNHITHLANTLAKKENSISTSSDSHTNNSGLKRLMGEVHTALRVLNQTPWP